MNCSGIRPPLNASIIQIMHCWQVGHSYEP
nr:MAG TPA: hypothetical protein [Bacteriophage sp.]